MSSRGGRDRALPLRVPAGEGEPAYSVLARLAHRYGTSGAAFAAANGLDWRAVLAGRETAVVARLADVDPEALAAATFVVGDGVVRLGDEILARAGWSPAGRRVCPACVTEDEVRLDAPQPRAFRRAWWDVRAIRRCPRHGSELSSAAPDAGPVAEAGGDAAASAGESYVLGRLGFAPRRHVALLDGLPLDKVVPLVERCGAMLAKGRWARADARSLDVGRLLTAGMAAFEGKGEPFQAFLDDLVATAEPGRVELGPRAAYGRLYAWLAHDERDPAYEAVREAVRTHATATLPLRTGQAVFGRPAGPQALHTIAQLCRDTGLERVTAERFLALAGTPDVPGPSPVALHRAADHARVVGLAAASCWSREARMALGLTTEGMASLVAAGCLVPMLPRSGRGTREERFARADVDRLLAALAVVSVVEDMPTGCALLSEAARRGMSSIGAVVRAFLDGRLASRGAMAGRTGLSGLAFGVGDVFALRGEPSPDVPWSEVVDHFGCSRVAQALVRSGHIGTRRGPCGFRNRHRREVPRGDWAGFRETFVTAGELARSSGSSAAAVARRLVRAGVRPAIAPDASGGRAFYRRDALPPGFKAMATGRPRCATLDAGGRVPAEGRRGT